MNPSLRLLLVASSLAVSPAAAAAAEEAVEAPVVTAAPSAPNVASPTPPDSTTATDGSGTAATPVAPPASGSPSPDQANTIVTTGDGRAPMPLGDGEAVPTTPGPRDPAPGVDEQATDQSLIGPSALEIQTVPNFFVEDFDIPPFLIPIYQAAGSEYGIRWEVLAAINRVETAFGTNLGVSSAGALGWMQFMPATWKQYGVDANADGEKDPFNPADAIFAAARYLKAAGGDKDLRKAIWAYNHADWYVDMVMDGATKIAAIPEPIVSGLAALTQGIFPVDADDRSIDYRGKLASASVERKSNGDGPETVRGEATADSIQISAPAGTRVVAAQDGVVEAVGQSARLGTYVRVRDAAGNRLTYAALGVLRDEVAVPRAATERRTASSDHAEPKAESEHAEPRTAPQATAPQATTPQPTTPRSTTPRAATPRATTPRSTTPRATTPRATTPRSTTPRATTPRSTTPRATPRATTPRSISTPTTPTAATPPKRRRGPLPRAQPTAQTATVAPHLATPEYARRDLSQPDPASTATPLQEPGVTPTGPLTDYFSIDYGLGAADIQLVPLRAGVHILAGTILGQLVDASAETTPSFRFEVRPAGANAPRIDPRPILDGWRLMDRTAFYRAQRQDALTTGRPPTDETGDATAGQVLLMSKAELQRRVLADRRITVAGCGRTDIKTGVVDRRILAVLEYLAVKGARPTVSSLQCGHSRLTSSGNVSEHTTGTAVDISSVYGTVITSATQGIGSPTDRAVREILALQGAMKPHQVITLMKYPGADNTLAMGDHDDHIHVGYRPTETAEGEAQPVSAFDPDRWDDLVERLGTLETPRVAAGPSRYSVSVRRPAGR